MVRRRIFAYNNDYDVRCKKYFKKSLILFVVFVSWTFLSDFESSFFRKIYGMNIFTFFKNCYLISKRSVLTKISKPFLKKGEIGHFKNVHFWKI